MRDVVIVSYAQTPKVRDAGAMNDVELVMQVVQEALGNIKMKQHDIDFTCSGSCDYLGGAAFAFVGAVDALGAVPPISESHVEQDAAWALYEAWLKMQAGSADSALIYGFGKSSHSDIAEVVGLQNDPYYYQPLWIDAVSTAAIQAQALLASGKATEEDMAKVVQNSRKNAMNNPNAQLKGEYSIDQLLAEETYISPLRKHDCCPVTDGASALVMMTREKAEEKGLNYAVIAGIDHRSDAHALGVRDLTVSNSARIAGEKAGVANGTVEFAELYAPFSHQEIILKEALSLGDDTDINPSGGALAGHVFMSCGLDRIGEAAARIMNGDAKRGVAHASSGLCLQQNLVAVLEGK